MLDRRQYAASFRVCAGIQLHSLPIKAGMIKGCRKKGKRGRAGTGAVLPPVCLWIVLPASGRMPGFDL